MRHMYQQAVSSISEDVNSRQGAIDEIAQRVVAAVKNKESTQQSVTDLNLEITEILNSIELDNKLFYDSEIFSKVYQKVVYNLLKDELKGDYPWTAANYKMLISLTQKLNYLAYGEENVAGFGGQIEICGGLTTGLRRGWAEAWTSLRKVMDKNVEKLLEISDEDIKSQMIVTKAVGSTKMHDGHTEFGAAQDLASRMLAHKIKNRVANIYPESRKARSIQLGR